MKKSLAAQESGVGGSQHRPHAEAVAICVATYLRPSGLERLLLGIGALTFGHRTAPSITVVVVDNDPRGSASAGCDALRRSVPWPIVYVHESRRGIPFARNAAVECAREAGAAVIAFLDDDEVPSPEWLDEMLRVMEAHDAEIVTGPVLPQFEGAAPSWIVRGKFFERPRDVTGAPQRTARTGNVLMRSTVLDGIPGPFDERKAFCGGTDTHLFLRLSKAGHRIVWADEAVVHEWNPPSRLTARWLLRRSFRVSSNWSACEREIQPTAGVLGLRVLKATMRLAQGITLLPVSVLGGRAAVVRALQCVSIGAGSLAGLLGWELPEYRATHGN